MRFFFYLIAMIEKIYKYYSKTYSVSIDSRKVKPGDVFFALKGENSDGNKFAKNALQNGAIAAVIDNPEYLSDGCILVDNSLKTLQKLANYHRNTLRAKVLAITGSNGKTTTKELIKAVTSKKYKVKATDGNLNNHIGVPLTLLSITPDIDIAIVEMGANGVNDIAELCDIAQPNYGIITNIGRAHLGGFGGFEGVKKAKGQLYRYLAENDGVVFFNDKNIILRELIDIYKPSNPVPYSKFINNAIVSYDSDKLFINVKIQEGDAELLVKTNLVGDYNLENILSAYVIGRYFNIEPCQINGAIEEYVPNNKRSQLIKTEKNTVILDAYNANPTSMMHALQNFKSLEVKNKVAIIGEMLELGEYSNQEHSKIVKLLSELNLDSILLVGDGFSKVNLPVNAKYFADVYQCLSYLKESPLKDKFILVKGSRGVKLEEILSLL